MTTPGLLIAIEGGDGTGKSTQVPLLAARLQALGHQVVTTREPGATPAGQAIRNLLLNPDVVLSPTAEMLLFAADRAQHVDEIITPAVNDGHIVITDRYVGSSIVYQGLGRGLPADQIIELSTIAGAFTIPTITVVLDLPESRDLNDGDRFEAEGAEFSQRVLSGFRDLAATHGWVVVSAVGTVDEVTDRLVDAVHVPLAARAQGERVKP